MKMEIFGVEAIGVVDGVRWRVVNKAAVVPLPLTLAIPYFDQWP